MILTCPSCATRYYANDSAIGPNGRTVRCAGCSHEWVAEPQLVLSATQPPKPEPLTRAQVERMRRAAEAPGPAPSAAARFRQQKAERLRRERVRAALAAWGVTGAALAASTGGAIVFRQDVAELWPRSASAFAAVGLDVNVYGLEFSDLAVERALEGPTPVLLVSGEVRNIGSGAKDAPPIRITLRDDHDREIFETVHRVDAPAIAAGQGTPFLIRVENPPVEAVDLEAAFAPGAPSPGANAPAAAAPHGANLDGPLNLTPEDAIGEDGEAAEEPAHSEARAGATAGDGLASRFEAEPLRDGG